MATTEWGFLISTNLFFGGLSAGLFLLSAIAFLLNDHGESRYPFIARYGALWAPWPVLAGTTMLTIDLGHWYRFYKLLLHFRLLSPMSIGTWLLTVFITLSLAYCFAWLTAAEREGLFGVLPKRLAGLRRFNRDLSHLRRPLAIAGIPLSLGVATYTGVLLGVLQARPFWNSSLVAQLFLVSAISAACAALILAGHWRRAPGADLRFLYAVDGAVLALEALIIVTFVAFGSVSMRPAQEAMRLVLGGPFTVLFWLCFFGAGVLLPLAIAAREFYPRLRQMAGGGIAEAVHQPAYLSISAAALVLGGAYLLRCIVIFAGQRSSI
jgi:formate-dependent nitrite reductase membrane component NrfD